MAKQNPEERTNMILEITIEGVSPLIMNNFTDEDQMAATNGQRVTFQGDKGTAKEQAEKKLYIDTNGQICVPQPNLLRCIIDAGIYFKNGRSKITTQKSSLIPGVLQIQGVMLPLTHGGWEVDTRPIRIPATGGRILRYRPVFEKWSVTFIADLDETELSENTFRAIVDTAGKKIGLGDFRPATKGPFGRFVVTSWVRR